MDRLSYFNYSPLRDWWDQSWYLQIIRPSCVVDTLQSLANLLACLEMQISLCTYSLITSIVMTFSLDCSPFTDNVIQKVKWHFNYVSSTQMDSSFGKIQEELKFQPPVVLTLEDTDVANGVMNGHTLMHLEPGRWPASLVLMKMRWECVFQMDIDCSTRKVFGWGAVYKICGGKDMGWYCFQVAFIKKKRRKLDHCDK